MSRLSLLTVATAFALSGCGAAEDNESANAANAMPSSKTENGQLTARVQGVDLKVNLPAPIRRMTEDDDFLYPGARTVQRNEVGGRRFHSDASPATIAAWYRDPARADRFSITTVRPNGSTFELEGTARDERFRIRLVPNGRGGTDGTILVTAGN